MFAITNVIILIVSYLIGSITTGDLVGRFKNVNLRQKGSGNVGATNVFRTMGSISGLIVLLGDMIKGVIAVLLGRLMTDITNFDPGILTGILAIIGHNWPVFTGFRGGKGIATSTGVIAILMPLSLAVVFPVWLIIFLIYGYVSLASVISCVAYPISVFILYTAPADRYKLLFAVFISIIAIYRHKSNIQRLLKGEENRILYKKRGAQKP